jgi:two-component system, OmpR family, sensor histidine kinase MprB
VKNLPLRARLTLLTALAVAVAVTGCAVGCWFLVRDKLLDQLDQSLSQGPAGGRPPHDGPDGFNPCQPSPRGDRMGGFGPTLQRVSADGTSCTAPGWSPIKVTGSDIAVAKGTSGPLYRFGTAADGTSLRVRTSPDGPGVALSAGMSTAGMDSSLDSLALLLIAVAAVGVVGAGSAGLLIARASLAPVDRLTDAVEHIARTEDLDTTIPAEGKDEIARLSRSFNAMTTALASSRERQRRLIADAGHELRTPLTSLRTTIDLLLRSEAVGRALPAGDKSRLLVNAKAQMLELSGLVGDLLDLSRPEVASADRQVEPIALKEVVEHTLVRARLRGPGLTFDVELDPWDVRGDPVAVERAVMNLLDNAVKFSPEDGTVTVRLHEGVLTVRDEGAGISAEDLPYVFDRFWRSPSARGLPGSGLGLAIVARVARETGGEVALSPAEPRGTLARLHLPGAQPA